MLKAYINMSCDGTKNTLSIQGGRGKAGGYRARPGQNIKKNTDI